MKEIKFKRKPRQKITFHFDEPLVLKESKIQRPSIEIEEVEESKEVEDFITGETTQKKVFVPKKATWNPVVLCLGENEMDGDEIQSLYNWMAESYHENKFVAKSPINITVDIEHEENIETWNLDNAYPTAVSFGDFVELFVEITLKYENMRHAWTERE
jgi:hypothetical protein